MITVNKTRTVVQEYKVYVAKDGVEFTSQEECINHEKFIDGERITCSNCGGRGRINERTERYFDGGMYGDHKYHSRVESDTCPICNGKGYLDKKVTWE